ncbi:MAG: hypothetical protein F4123_03570 [Gemmatimonadetes bacterium]|nr:hypothetical protein [Gemmatimonadota bacterium]MYI45465.1 hypothetical protein [Gemmatimonadota bacterium]
MVFISDNDPMVDQASQQLCVFLAAEKVAGVEMVFGPRFLCLPNELPVVEPRAQSACDSLVVSGTVVAAETVVGKTKCLREIPALAAVCGEKNLNALASVATGGLNPGVEVPERDEREDGVAQFGIQLSIQAPEALGIQLAGRDSGGGQVALLEDAEKVRV